MIFIQSQKDGGIDDSERAMMRACHLSGQMEADKAIDHYSGDSLADRFEAEAQQDDWDALTCLVVFLILVAAGSILVAWVYS